MDKGYSVNSNKKIVSIILLVFCAVFLVVMSLGVGASLSLRHVAIIKYGEQTIRLELNSKVNLQDDTIEKLSKKITVTSTGADGKFGDLVMVTNKCVMFDYTIDNKTYYFSAMGTKLDKTPKDIYLTATGDLTIASYSALSSFRDNVNNGTTYSGSTVTLTKDLNLGGVEWTPIGTVLNKNFQGTFDGGGHTISNFVITKAYVAGKYICPGNGFFGFVQKNCTIKNLQISDATMTLKDEGNNRVPYGYGILVGYFGNGLVTTYTGDVDDSYTGRSQSLYISNCSVINSSINVPSGLAGQKDKYTPRNWPMAIGGLIGASNLSTIIYNCSVDTDIIFGTGTKWGDSYSDGYHSVGGIMGGHIQNALEYQPYGLVRISNCLYSGKISLDLAACYNRGAAAGILGSASSINSSMSPYARVEIYNCVAAFDFVTNHVVSTHPIFCGNMGEGSGYNEFYTNAVSGYEYKKPYYRVEMYNNYFYFKTNNTAAHAKSAFNSYITMKISLSNYNSNDIMGSFCYDGKTIVNIRGTTITSDPQNLLYMQGDGSSLSYSLEIPYQVDPDNNYDIIKI